MNFREREKKRFIESENNCKTEIKRDVKFMPKTDSSIIFTWAVRTDRTQIVSSHIYSVFFNAIPYHHRFFKLKWIVCLPYTYRFRMLHSFFSRFSLSRCRVLAFCVWKRNERSNNFLYVSCLIFRLSLSQVNHKKNAFVVVKCTFYQAI